MGSDKRESQMGAQLGFCGQTYASLGIFGP
jgi:hypothetical protein